MNTQDPSAELRHVEPDSENPSTLTPPEAMPIAHSGPPDAPRALRFFAALVDLSLLVVVALPGLTRLYQQLDPFWTREVPEVFLEVTRVGLISLALFNLFLLVQFRQSIGKRVAGIAIVNLDGTPASATMLVIRLLPLFILGLAFVGVPPETLGALWAIDILWILRDDRRCLHDVIAETRVVEVAPT